MAPTEISDITPESGCKTYRTRNTTTGTDPASDLFRRAQPWDWKYSLKIKDEGGKISVMESNSRFGKFDAKRVRLGRKVSDNAFACPLITYWH